MYPIIVDNLFEDPDEVRNYALGLQYLSPTNEGWLGYRCSTMNESFLTMLVKKIYQYIPNFSFTESFYYCFHYSLEKTKQTCSFDFDEYKVHSDFCDFAGLIYLHPNPPKKMGTSFYNDKKECTFSVENKYNRLVYYPGTMLHGPTNLFGETKENGRLTLTFFSNIPSR